MQHDEDDVSVLFSLEVELQQLLEGIQVVLTGHHSAKHRSTHVGVHSLSLGEFEHLNSARARDRHPGEMTGSRYGYELDDRARRTSSSKLC